MKRSIKATLSTILLLASVFMGVTATADPKRPVAIEGESPFENCNADTPDTQQGMVFIGSEVEPWVAVDPTNPDHIVASWQQDRWSTGGARGLVSAVTFDGGRNWQPILLPGLTPCTGNDDFIRASDPWLTFAPNGDLFHISLAVSRSLIDLLFGQSATGRSAMLVHKSTDGGLTWSGPVALVDEDFNGLHDKQSITADPFDSNFIYAVWDRLDFAAGGGPTLFSRTADHGETWDSAKVVYDPGANGQTLSNQIVVHPDGTLLLFFTEIAFTPEGESLELALMRSSDRGENWSGPFLVSDMRPSLNLVEPDSLAPVRGGEELFDVAIDGENGTLYAVWQDARFSESRHESVALVVSEDGGLTWTAPVKINQTPPHLPPLQQQAFVPSVEVNSKGDVAITYYDFRFNDPGGQALTDSWATTCRPKPFGNCAAPDEWTAEIRLTEQSFDIGTAPVAGGLFLGDYNGLAASRDRFVAVFAISFSTDPASLLFRTFKKAPEVVAQGR